MAALVEVFRVGVVAVVGTVVMMVAVATVVAGDYVHRKDRQPRRSREGNSCCICETPYPQPPF